MAHCRHLALAFLSAVSFPGVANSFLYLKPSGRSLASSSLAMSSSARKPQKIVIAGAGVIGTTTAYYLAKEFGISSTLIDPSGEIAPAASGKAGGFLALDWNDYSSVGPLTRRSFQLHQEIADDVGASNIQYRRLTCAAISLDSKNARPKGKKLEGVEWAEGATVMGMQPLGDEQTIAQVHPKMLCETLYSKACELAPETSTVKGKVVGAKHGDDGKLIGALLEDGSVVKGDALLFACGPWTADIMTGTKYHSVILPTTTSLSQCVFFSGYGDPEVYVRPDQTAYCTGFPDPPVFVKERPGHEEVRSDAVAKIQNAVQKASQLDGEPTLTQACYLPSTPDGVPMMGPLQDMQDCYVATGHTCWGILMGPASGESMAHLIATGESPHIDLSPFTPSRFGTFQMVPSSSLLQRGLFG
jgi:glycine/D-amino acid oxidase-like deaminating enzyme